jgi:hypothetical protein
MTVLRPAFVLRREGEKDKEHAERKDEEGNIVETMTNVGA